jgi:hypothetical protein
MPTTPLAQFMHIQADLVVKAAQSQTRTSWQQSAKTRRRTLKVCADDCPVCVAVEDGE